MLSGCLLFSPSRTTKATILLFAVLQHVAAQMAPTALSSRGHTLPYNILVILPAKESNNDKFGLTIERARPVIDIAVEDVVKSGRMPPGWVNLTFWDDRYWEDTNLAERYATVGMVKAYCERRLDAILGFADSYGLATVTKVSAGLNGGVPVLTTAGMPSTLNLKKTYPFLTRMQGSYYQLAVSMYQLVAYQDPADEEHVVPPRNASSICLNYLKMLFLYHDKKRAVNKPNHSDSRESEVSSSHCYFSLYAIKNYFTEKSELFKREWQLSTPSFPFDEEMPRTRETTKQWLQQISMDTNGGSNVKHSYVLLWHFSFNCFALGCCFSDCFGGGHSYAEYLGLYRDNRKISPDCSIVSFALTTTLFSYKSPTKMFLPTPQLHSTMAHRVVCFSLVIID
ncbi:unnamed protein product [Haemonchus placei]|uniref:ANF_receptor domain-containing protein n=1 Tax=Haemonchus placei TaxID=6290 RepID=A0A0N4WLC3_HAEPC|nr:unnamed protein product [Haemonchus placei]